MFRKTISILLAFYAIVGIIIVMDIAIVNRVYFFETLCLLVLIPMYGSYGVWRNKQIPIVGNIVLFGYLSVRFISGDSVQAIPISLAVPFGDFSRGEGFLVDFFAISMVIILTSIIWIPYYRRKRGIVSNND